MRILLATLLFASQVSHAGPTLVSSITPESAAEYINILAQEQDALRNDIDMYSNQIRDLMAKYRELDGKGMLKYGLEMGKTAWERQRIQEQVMGKTQAVDKLQNELNKTEAHLKTQVERSLKVVSPEAIYAKLTEAGRVYSDVDQRSSQLDRIDFYRGRSMGAPFHDLTLGTRSSVGITVNGEAYSVNRGQGIVIRGTNGGMIQGKVLSASADGKVVIERILPPYVNATDPKLRVINLKNVAHFDLFASPGEITIPPTNIGDEATTYRRGRWAAEGADQSASVEDDDEALVKDASSRFGRGWRSGSRIPDTVRPTSNSLEDFGGLAPGSFH
jgi:hypothetical protein